MKHTLVALVEDKPGVLNRVASMFRRRGFNIESLAVGHTEQRGISRMTFQVDAANTAIDLVVKNLYKIIEVIKVTDVTGESTVDRELLLIKVAANAGTRGEILQVSEMFQARILDVAPDSLIVEAVASEEKIDSLIQMLRGYGIKEMARTGRISMIRGSATAMMTESDMSRRNGKLRPIRSGRAQEPDEEFPHAAADPGS